MELLSHCLLAALLACSAWPVSAKQCSPRAHTEWGWVCGSCDPSQTYAKYLAVPYAAQPVGELRFQELRNPERWKGCLDASQSGPICHQHDVFYGPIMKPHGVSEACIHANVFAPLLPRAGRLLPVLVYVHGGGFDFGSGDPDAHGPEFLVRQNVIVITFNYRIGVFGFLSLNTSSVPGNAGLRDMVTLLRWVRRNAAAFGGDPDDVTLAGQSAGAAAAHLLSLSDAAKGLFKRAILMSGTASRSFFTTSPFYARTIADMFLDHLGINSTDLEEVHRQLVDLPVKTLMDAHNRIQETTGLLAFTPVVESQHPGVERIVEDDPEILQARGRGNDVPLIIGFTNAECETFRPRFEAIDIVKRIEASPLVVAPLGVIYTTSPEVLPEKIAAINQEYFNETLNLERFLKLCSDSFFIYPALKLAESRAASGGAPVFLYRFAYHADYSVYKHALRLKYRGAGHSEDLTFLFRANHALHDRALSATDSAMATNMTMFVTNFMRHSKPQRDGYWPAVQKHKLQYKNIINYEEADPSMGYRWVIKFFDRMYGAAS